MRAWVNGLALFLSGLSASAQAAPQTISLDDVTKYVSTQNFAVLENALKVYQAKETIEAARGSLIPNLNLWKVGSVAAGGGTMALTMIEDIVPFLVPANWFRFDEAKVLYLAEKESYRALWANEVRTAKALYLHSLLDQSILDHVDQSKSELQNLYLIVHAREQLGGIPDGASREIQTRVLSLQEDDRSLRVLVNEELSLLVLMMGMPAETSLLLKPVPPPSMDSLPALVYDDFVYRVTDSSPETREYGYLVEASGFVRNEIKFSFLGGSSISRGVEGGVFDNIPISGGLGFGTGPSLQIASAEKQILQTDQAGAMETVKRELKVLVDNYNLDLANYVDLKTHVSLAELSLQKLYDRLRLGQNIEIADLVTASKEHIDADTSFFAVQYRFLLSQDKLMRLLFEGDYSKVPAAIELVRAGGLR